MRLKRSSTFVPGLIFVVISTAFVIIQGFMFNVIAWNYNFCHSLFGFTFPFLMSYLSYERSDIRPLAVSVKLKGICAVRWCNWPLALVRTIGGSVVRDFREGISWNPLIGVLYVLAGSMANEMWIDPLTNGIPFSEAYQNFIADSIGMAAFLAVTHRSSRRGKQQRSMRQA